MIMNDFMSQVEKHMIQLRKRNMNSINQFKIQMFQTRKNIEKNIIKMQFGISDSQLMNIRQSNQNLSILQKNTKNSMIDKDLSTNYNSRAIQSKLNDNCQISRFTNNFNKENQDPNRRVHTDISVIEQFPVKHTEYSNEDMYNELNALKNDESIQINTQDVKKKYQKFISPSAGWTVSAQPIRQKLQNKHHRQITPFSTQFGHQDEQFNQQNNHSFRKDFDLFGFKEIDERHFSRTNTIQELEGEENNQSQNY